MTIQKKVGRDSKYELLRLFAMILITISHIPNNSPVGTLGYLLGSINISAGEVGVNIFVLVGCWFLCERKPYIERIFRLVFQVVFYSVVFSGVSHLLGTKMSIRSMLLSFSYWFPFGYVVMQIVYPYLQRISETSKRIVLCSGILTATFIMLIKMMGYNNIVTHLFSKGLFIGPVWFSLVFMFVDCYKEAMIRFFESIDRRILLFAACATYTIMVVLVHVFDFASARSVYSPICFLSALLFFGYFNKLRLNCVDWINALSATTFSVYLIQSHRVFRKYVWDGIIRFEYLSTTNLFLYAWGIIAIIVLLCAVSYVIDPVWKRIYKEIGKMKAYRAVCTFFDSLLFTRE